MERPGCCLAGTWRLGYRKTVFGGQDSSNTIAPAFRQFHQRDLRRVWASVSRQRATVTSHSSAGVAVSRRTRNYRRPIPAAARRGDRRQCKRHVWREVADRSNPDASANRPSAMEYGFLWSPQGDGMSAVCSFSRNCANRRIILPVALSGSTFPDGTRWSCHGIRHGDSSQIAFSSGPQNYIGQAFAAMAGLMLAAGSRPSSSLVKFSGGSSANASGWRFYDADTQAAAQSALGRALATFHTAERRSLAHQLRRRKLSADPPVQLRGRHPEGTFSRSARPPCSSCCGR